MNKTITIDPNNSNITIEQTAVPQNKPTEIMGVKLATGSIALDIAVIFGVLAVIVLGKKWLDKK
tara:strand:+ start:866 stop:1057 length:192 start_codon:yes stop_codon:yes gene_type:complete